MALGYKIIKKKQMPSIKIFVTLTALLVLSAPVLSNKDHATNPKYANCFTNITPPNLFLGAPGAGWAMALTKQIEFMYCFKGATNVQFSYQDIMCSCPECATRAGSPHLGGNTKMAANFVKANGVAGGYSFNQSNKDQATNAPGGYKRCLDLFNDDCYPTTLFGVNKCPGAIKQFNSILDPQSCPKQCNVGGGEVAHSRSRDLFSSFIEKQGYQNI